MQARRCKHSQHQLKEKETHWHEEPIANGTCWQANLYRLDTRFIKYDIQHLFPYHISSFSRFHSVLPIKSGHQGYVEHCRGLTGWIEHNLSFKNIQSRVSFF